VVPSATQPYADQVGVGEAEVLVEVDVVVVDVVVIDVVVVDVVVVDVEVVDVEVDVKA